MLVTPVRVFVHDGCIYQSGDLFELPDDMANEGIGYGILKAASDTVKAPEFSGGALDNEEYEDSFVKAKKPKKKAKK